VISTFKDANHQRSHKRSAQARIIRGFVAIIKTYAKCEHKKQRHIIKYGAVFLYQVSV